ncbi:MAG: hypothetical protein HOV92_12740 [Streptomyces sp.]|nr:hypothetical protein [Streptomyces sp.]
MPTHASHEGYDQMGAPTTHHGLLENCPAPECQDRIIEQQDERCVGCGDPINNGNAHGYGAEFGGCV